jgi:hypothetical protein
VLALQEARPESTCPKCGRTYTPLIDTYFPVDSCAFCHIDGIGKMTREQKKLYNKWIKRALEAQIARG